MEDKNYHGEVIEITDDGTVKLSGPYPFKEEESKAVESEKTISGLAAGFSSAILTTIGLQIFAKQVNPWFKGAVVASIAVGSHIAEKYYLGEFEKLVRQDERNKTPCAHENTGSFVHRCTQNESVRSIT